MEQLVVVVVVVCREIWGVSVHARSLARLGHFHAARHSSGNVTWSA